MDQGREWAKAIAKGIGERVAYYRGKRMSAQQLADRCAELGMPSISRVVITKLENGRREAVSTSEVQVLAEALGVPAADLLFPIGYTQAMEVVPGRELDPWDALRWFLGGADVSSSRDTDPERAISLWSDHRRLVMVMKTGQQIRRERQEWVSTRQHADPREREVDERLAAAHAEIVARELAADVISLRRLRGQIRSLGMTPPALDPEIAALLGEEVADGEHREAP